jgi:hypothetical protein
LANFDFKDIYIPNEIIQDEIVDVIIQKYEMILFTNKGEVLGEPDLGGDLERLLHQTKVSSKFVEKELNKQISEYIPELTGIDYQLEVSFEPNPNNYSDIMLIDFKIKGKEVNAYFV